MPRIFSVLMLAVGLVVAGCDQNATSTTATPSAPPKDTKSWAERYQTALSIVEHEERRLRQLEPAMHAACRLCVSVSPRGRDYLKTAADAAESARKHRNDMGVHSDLHQSFAKLDDIQRDQAIGWLEEEVNRMVIEVVQRDNAAIRKRWDGYIGDFGPIQQFWDQQDQLDIAQKEVERLRKERK